MEVEIRKKKIYIHCGQLLKIDFKKGFKETFKSLFKLLKGQSF